MYRYTCKVLLVERLGSRCRDFAACGNIEFGTGEEHRGKQETRHETSAIISNLTARRERNWRSSRTDVSLSLFVSVSPFSFRPSAPFYRRTSGRCGRGAGLARKKHRNFTGIRFAKFFERECAFARRQRLRDIHYSGRRAGLSRKEIPRIRPGTSTFRIFPACRRSPSCHHLCERKGDEESE